MNVIEIIMSILAPHECLTCRAEGGVLCPSCAVLLPKADVSTTLAGLDAVYASTQYSGVAKQIVHGLKFERQKAASEAMATLIVLRMPAGVQSGITMVTHVPTATSRVRQRGYDQAEQVARQVAIRLRVPCRTLLDRYGQSRQVGTSRQERQRQVAHAYRARRQHIPQDGCILLIDDVLTTGATLSAAALELRQAGAVSVVGAVFAIADRTAGQTAQSLL
jgi:ComF family protein